MSAEMPIMYGIANCDTIKKARNWLQQKGIDYQFHDYKKQAVSENLLQRWIADLGWEQLINKRGTSWRKLDESTRESMDDTKAIATMLDNPSIIKRPLIEYQSQRILGFNEAEYNRVFFSR